MTELELLKVVMHKLAKIEAQMMKKSDVKDMVEHYITQEEQTEAIQSALDDLKRSVEEKHLENINSDELLLRSIGSRDSRTIF
ncbi:hypothetical protein SAMN05421736_11054 [Evansella caseinilytica]|uniref:Uncharacterized protein n=1 Tax=Evansella caseinilytica TaxID=1503961 RepID=A0A1H3S8P1_9BACI|nr:hypothetical protein [Evansella caseinilytica]SDZ33921.1 hypothetical protein SAMN05421736_11054 [Evansella caseinilytica]